LHGLERGYAVFSIDYRLIREAKFPQQIYEGMKTAAILLKKQKGKCSQCNLYFLPDDNFEVLHLNGDKKDFKGKNLNLIHERCSGELRGMQDKH
jgi:hypothetical protein